MEFDNNTTVRPMNDNDIEIQRLTNELAKVNQELANAYLDSIETLRTTVEAKDPYTRGHSDRVAAYSVLLGRRLGLSEEDIKTLQIGGLFHDIPEVLTRDIVSPVKTSVKGLDDIIKDIEDVQMRKVIYPLVTPEIKKEIEFYTMDEFSSKVTVDSAVIRVSSDEINQKYNSSEFSPIDGELIRACDHLSAYLEAYMSMKCGVSSEQIQSGYHNLFQQYENRQIASVDFGQLFDYFRI